MNKNFVINQIGVIHANEEGFYLKVKEEFRDALIGIEDYKYINVMWWFSKSDNITDRNNLVEEKPYHKGPEKLGIFATRSPQRPNPIALSCSCVTYVDREKGIVGLTYIDANDNTPLLDIKPYIPSLDRVEEVTSPKWSKHWPQNVESSGDFNWEEEFNF